MRTHRATTAIGFLLLIVTVGCSGGSAGRTAGVRPEPPTSTTASAATCDRTTQPARRSLKIGKVNRSYLLTPAARPEQRRANTPLVILIHGHGANAGAFSAATRLPAKGAQAGVTVVAPDGAEHTWAPTGTGPDAAFMDALLKDVAERTCIDQTRIVLAGFSAGALFAIAYGCAHPGRVAAVVTVATEQPIGCSYPLAITAFHGTADTVFPYQRTLRDMASWAKRNHCASMPTIGTAGSEVARYEWTGCGHGADVVLYEIEGGGHTWPGSDESKVPEFVRRSSGKTTQQVDASDVALQLAQRATAYDIFGSAATTSTTLPATAPRIARADTSRTVLSGGDTVHCIATAAQTGGAYSFLEIEVPNGNGPPLHRHPADEWFYVLDGTAAIQVGELRRTVRTGDYFHVPRGALHSFKATSAVRLLAGYAPGGEEEHLFCPR